MKNIYKIMIVIVVGLGVIYYRSDRKISQLNDVITSQNKTIDSLRYHNDSLYSEAKRFEIDLGRYMAAESILMEENPQVSKIYGEILSNLE